MLGNPLKKELLGHTSLDLGAFSDYIAGLGQDQFAGRRYDLFKHNCNTFSNVVANFLCKKSIPQYILDLPDRFLSTPIGAMLRPIIEQMTPRDVGPTSHDSLSGAAAASGENPAPAESATRSYDHFPVKEYLTFSTDIDLGKLMTKLEELNTKYGGILSPEDLDAFKKIASESAGAKWWPKAHQVLSTWSGSDTFPVLDLIRWRLSKAPIPDDVAGEIFDCLTGYLTKSDTTPEPAIRLSLRTAANLFAHFNTRQLMIKNRESFVGFMNDVVENLSGIEPESKRQQSEIAAATIALNYSKAILDSSTLDPEAEFQLVSSLCFTFSQNIKSDEALYRTLVAIGSLAVKHEDVKSLAVDLGVRSFLSRVPKNKLTKLDEVTTECKFVFDN